MTARHTVMTLAAALTAICLAACAPAETGSQPQNADSVTTSAAAETNQAEKTEAQTSKTEAQTEPTETTASSKAEAAASAPAVEPTEETPSFDLSEFRLSDYCAEFDEAEPMRYELVDSEALKTIDEEKLALAEAAVLSSEYYAEVLPVVKEYFRYENGEIVTDVKDSIWPMYFESYVTYSEADGISVEPQLYRVYHAAFDGKNTEDLFVFDMPLPMSQIEWSGTGGFSVPVYVNSADEAIILTAVAAQSLYGITPVRYDDGAVHVIFQRGHTTGTAQAHILSFSEGEPHIEFECSTVGATEKAYMMYSWAGGTSAWNTMFFRDAVRGCYCEVSGEQLDEDTAELLRGCSDISERYPNITEEDIYAVGGRYLTVGSDSFEIVNGEIVPYENTGSIVPANLLRSEEDASICLNIDLNKWN